MDHNIKFGSKIVDLTQFDYDLFQNLKPNQFNPLNLALCYNSKINSHLTVTEGEGGQKLFKFVWHHLWTAPWAHKIGGIMLNNWGFLDYGWASSNKT